MSEASRSATIEDLKVLAASLNENGVEYLLIGGYALAAHGYHRATVDIDVLVPASREMGRSVRQALLVLPDRAAADIDPEWMGDSAIALLLTNSSRRNYPPGRPCAASRTGIVAPSPCGAT